MRATLPTAAVIIPFPTAVLSSALAHSNHDDLRAAVALYALAAVVMSASWMVVFHYLRQHPELLIPDTPRDHFRTQSLRPITGLVAYGLSSLLGWFIDPDLRVRAGDIGDYDGIAERRYASATRRSYARS